MKPIQVMLCALLNWNTLGSCSLIYNHNIIRMIMVRKVTMLIRIGMLIRMRMMMRMRMLIRMRMMMTMRNRMRMRMMTWKKKWTTAISFSNALYLLSPSFAYRPGNGIAFVVELDNMILDLDLGHIEEEEKANNDTLSLNCNLKFKSARPYLYADLWQTKLTM